MTTYDHRLATAGGAIETAVPRGRSALARGLKRIHYAQMVSVLNRLPDIYLNESGLRRGDIPEHARRLVYGEE